MKQPDIRRQEGFISTEDKQKMIGGKNAELAPKNGQYAAVPLMFESSEVTFSVHLHIFQISRKKIVETQHK